MAKDIEKILDKEFLAKMKNKDIKNDSNYFIMFSGMPRSGKTALAKKIEERYQGLRIKHDTAREIIYANVEITDTRESEEILERYLTKREQEISKFQNKLIIWDSSIDRKYKRMNDWAKSHGFKTFVICLDTPLDMIKHRIDTELDPSTAKWYYVNLEKWKKDHKEYIKTQKVNFTVKNRSDNDVRLLFDRLDKILKLKKGGHYGRK